MQYRESEASTAPESEDDEPDDDAPTPVPVDEHVAASDLGEPRAQADAQVPSALPQGDKNMLQASGESTESPSDITCGDDAGASTGQPAAEQEPMIEEDSSPGASTNEMPRNLEPDSIREEYVDPVVPEDPAPQDLSSVERHHLDSEDTRQATAQPEDENHCLDFAPSASAHDAVRDEVVLSEDDVDIGEASIVYGMVFADAEDDEDSAECEDSGEQHEPPADGEGDAALGQEGGEAGAKIDVEEEEDRKMGASPPKKPGKWWHWGWSTRLWAGNNAKGK